MVMISKDELKQRILEIKASNSPSRLDAVKLVKDLTGWDLKASLDFVNEVWNCQ